MFFVVIILLVAVALAAGLIANRWVRPFAKSEVQGVKLELLVSPLLTLTVLLLSFLLVQVYVSYSKTRTSASEEAGKVFKEYTTFGFLDRSYARPAQTALLCYTRATIDLEWPQLADDPDFSDEVGFWGAQIDPVLKRLATFRNDQPYGFLLSLDKERFDARRVRISEAEPTVPRELQLLLLVLSAAAIGTIGAFTLPYVTRRVQIGALIVLAFSVVAMQLAIIEVDNKFSGAIQVEPTSFETAEEALSKRWTETYPDSILPCDEEGRPIATEA